MRTFIAITLPEEIKDFLGSLQAQLKKAGADVKWVSPKNIHLTLKFLGEIDENNTGKAIGAIETVAAGHSAFQVRLCSLGAFPSLSSPRVIWAAIDEGNSQTIGIAKELEERLAIIGFEKEGRPFSTHITLGRVRSALNKEKLARLLTDHSEGFSQEQRGFTAEAITLFKSTLQPQGPYYEILRVANLRPI